MYIHVHWLSEFELWVFDDLQNLFVHSTPHTGVVVWHSCWCSGKLFLQQHSRDCKLCLWNSTFRSRSGDSACDYSSWLCLILTAKQLRSFFLRNPFLGCSAQQTMYTLHIMHVIYTKSSLLEAAQEMMLIGADNDQGNWRHLVLLRQQVYKHWRVLAFPENENQGGNLLVTQLFLKHGP